MCLLHCNHSDPRKSDLFCQFPKFKPSELLALTQNQFILSSDSKKKKKYYTAAPYICSDPLKMAMKQADPGEHVIPNQDAKKEAQGLLRA